MPRKHVPGQTNVERRADRDLVAPSTNPGQFRKLVVAGKVGATDEALTLDAAARELREKWQARHEYDSLRVHRHREEIRLLQVEQERRRLDDIEQKATAKLAELDEIEKRGEPEPINWLGETSRIFDESGYERPDDAVLKKLEREVPR